MVWGNFLLKCTLLSINYLIEDKAQFVAAVSNDDSGIFQQDSAFFHTAQMVSGTSKCRLL